MLKKINKIIVLIITIMIFTICLVDASSKIGEEHEAEECLENFCKYINYGSDESFKYIDTSNTELYNNVEENLHSLKMSYQIKEITENNNVYNIKARIAANGVGWQVNGLVVNFELKEIDNQYKITNTTLYDVIGSDNVFSLLIKLFIILGVLMITVFGIVIVVLYVVTRKK